MVDVAPQLAAPAEYAATSARRYFTLGLLTVVYALNFLDRTIFNVLIEPIKKEFVLSDTTMGLLAGFGFVLFYSLLGIPAIMLLIATCFGQGVGPLAVGVVNDALKQDFGTDAVRYSLLSAAVATTLGALLFVWAAAFVREDIKRAA